MSRWTALAALPLLLVTACALPSTAPAPSGIEHDGYILACEGVEAEACRTMADAVADFALVGDEIRWMTVRPEETVVCGARGPLTYCHAVTVDSNMPIDEWPEFRWAEGAVERPKATSSGG